MTVNELEPDTLAARLRERLSGQAPRVEHAAEVRQAAVLVPLVFHDQLPYVLFTLRTEEMPTHKGQVSFPGGGFKAADLDLRATALRETHEEIGIRPDQVEVLGEMDQVSTMNLSFVLLPVVGLLMPGFKLQPDPREVAAVLQVPLAHLLEPANRVPDLQTGHWRYPWDTHHIWGATARILNDFLRILGHVDPFDEDLRILQALSDPHDKVRFTELMKTFHPKGRSVAEYVRSGPPSVATPAIRELVAKSLLTADGTSKTNSLM